jgi:hypothetical protein
MTPELLPPLLELLLPEVPSGPASGAPLLELLLPELPPPLELLLPELAPLLLAPPLELLLPELPPLEVPLLPPVVASDWLPVGPASSDPKPGVVLDEPHATPNHAHTDRIAIVRRAMSPQSDGETQRGLSIVRIPSKNREKASRLETSSAKRPS